MLRMLVILEALVQKTTGVAGAPGHLASWMPACG
jgi:hypothetical protein